MKRSSDTETYSSSLSSKSGALLVNFASFNLWSSLRAGHYCFDPSITVEWKAIQILCWNSYPCNAIGTTSSCLRILEPFTVIDSIVLVSSTTLAHEIVWFPACRSRTSLPRATATYVVTNEILLYLSLWQQSQHSIASYSPHL